MADLRVLLYTTKGSYSRCFHDEDGVMTSEIEDTFIDKCDIEIYPKGGSRLKNTQKTRDAISSLISKYQLQDIAIKGLDVTKKLEEGEFFYFFNGDKTDIVNRRTAIECLNVQSKSGIHIFPVMFHNAIFHRLSLINFSFKFYSYGYDGLKSKIGEEDKAKRSCRFCGNTGSEKFKDIAHAIPEALGNKLLVCNEECDACNHTLNAIEDNFTALMDFRRSLYKISRKQSSKAAQVIGTNCILRPDENGDAHVYIKKESIPIDTDTSKPFVMQLNNATDVVNEKIYKALCKMVIDLLPSEELTHFKNTINWITNEFWLPDSLPSALYTIFSQTFHEQPILDLYIKKNILEKGPYCTAVLWLYDMAYMFIIPFVDVDKGKYKYDSNLTQHWRTMNSYFLNRLWVPQNTYDYTSAVAWYDMTVDVSNPFIHIVPESDKIFDLCPKEKLSNDNEIEFPDILPNIINSVTIKSIGFKCLTDEIITNNDLIDITVNVARVPFILSPNRKVVHIKVALEANDTTNTKPYFSCYFNIDIKLYCFNRNIVLKYDGNGQFEGFAFDYRLRDFLFRKALEHAEKRMKSKREGTPFTECTLPKLLSGRRFMEQVLYVFPEAKNGGNFISVRSNQIEKRQYEK
jgi:hypothetical protein